MQSILKQITKSSSFPLCVDISKMNREDVMRLHDHFIDCNGLYGEGIAGYHDAAQINCYNINDWKYMGICHRGYITFFDNECAFTEDGQDDISIIISDNSGDNKFVEVERAIKVVNDFKESIETYIQLIHDTTDCGYTLGDNLTYILNANPLTDMSSIKLNIELLEKGTGVKFVNWGKS